MSGIDFPSDSLCPGYKFVQEFGPNEEYEEEEEVFYVTMELGNIEPTLVPSSDSIRLILAGTIFKGSHDLLLGSELLFTEKKDEQDRSKRHLSYVGTTSQRIQFREVQLRPKSDSTGLSTADKDSGESSPTETSGYAHGLDCVTGKEAPQKKTRRKGPKPKEKEKETGNAGDGLDPAAKPKKKGKKKSGRKGKEKEDDDYDGEANDETTGESRRTSNKKRKRGETNDGGENKLVGGQGDAEQSQNLD
ncbi:hypothetical protein Moror_13326 [Moniliophthora roreri MCA 2997]|uniref:Transcription factor TFIIIC triple barrel domain-containing protein n=1 Tax=Moniliophthora roreri (strain MCA 2997) TaxID=1381753 RepID=V2XZ23_MONRO|nr:hypothetical protein Moror_13326 [Moniliophthora roreri MCA 2997]